MFHRKNCWKPCSVHEYPAERSESWPGLICVQVHCLDPHSPPPSHNWCMVRTTPLPFPFAAMVGLLRLGFEQQCFSTLNRCHMNL
jgi:hypothetical protein